MKPLSLKQFIQLDESSSLLSPLMSSAAILFLEARKNKASKRSAKTTTKTVAKTVVTAKSVKGKAGGVLQNKIAKSLLSFMPSHLNGRIEVESNFKSSADYGIGSVQPDITIHMLDKNGNRTGTPIVIEVKKAEAQGVSVTLSRENGKWFPTDASKEKWMSMSLVNRNSVLKKLKVVETRLNQMLPIIGKWMGNTDTENGKIAFFVTKEIWRSVLNKFATGEKWRIELDKYWSTLQGLASKGGDHFVYIEGVGLLSSGASLPAWFKQGKEVPMLSSLDKIDSTAREMEVRLKRGHESDTRVQLKRKIYIESPSITQIKPEAKVYMDEATVAQQSKSGMVSFDTNKRAILVDGKPYIYSTTNLGFEVGIIKTIDGTPKKVKGLMGKNGPVYEVNCTIASKMCRVTFAIAPRVEGDKSATTFNKGLDIFSKSGAEIFWSCIKVK